MWISIIGAVATIIGTVVIIFIALRSKQVFRHVLTFNIGLLYANQGAIPKPYKKVFKKAAISTLIYGANVPQNSEVVFVCPYLLINNSKLPISNITLQLNYASKYAIENEGLMRRGVDYEVVFGFSPEDYKSREVQILDSMAEIRCTIPVLRPGEKFVIADLMKFTNLDRCEESDDEDYVVGRGLAKKLREIKKLRDFCVVDVFVYSESCLPLSRRIKLLWFDTNSDKELASLMDDCLETFWGGQLPKPGLYWCPWPLIRKKIVVKEYGEAIIPKLKVVKTSEGRYFCWENALKSGRNIFCVGMPPWNYYQSSDNLDTDDLIMMSGFQRLINGEQMEKLRNIFKGLRK